MKSITTTLLALTISFCFSFILAQEEKKSLELKEQTVKTKHKLVINNSTLNYTATAGTIILKNKDQKPAASIFYVAYSLDDNITNRPVTFSFNGGPGSSSFWLNLGILGPKRVKMSDNGRSTPPPYHLIDNIYSVLPNTDLVFIDPVGTGFSIALDPTSQDFFYGIDEDIQATAEFIRLYLSKNNRFNSPKLIIGESYGGFRACGVTSFLQNEYGLYINGIMLISPFTNDILTWDSPGNELPYMTTLPFYTATAWFHNKLNDDLMPDLFSTIKKSETFAHNELALAIIKGNNLSESELNSLALNLSEFTGLDVEYLKSKKLRISTKMFYDKLLEKEGLMIGRYDSRLTRRINPTDSWSNYAIYDPSTTFMDGSYSSTFFQYLKTDLNYPDDRQYITFNSSIANRWKLGKFKGRPIYLGEDISRALIKNPFLKIFVAAGYYDGATPFSVTNYCFDHIHFEENTKDNVTIKYYEAGHMIYNDQTQLQKLSEDLNQFIKSAY
ncbi:MULTISPECIES: S10 family peptidase [unclassified Carboxylicivirga]|uniref:S10 family peptidase n=1 Tax=Carboxylicivirga TaxID=1628153 RepID=UPI003D33E0CF